MREPVRLMASIGMECCPRPGGVPTGVGRNKRSIILPRLIFLID